MSDVLASIYSTSNVMKRKLADALRNPGGTLANMAGNAHDGIMRLGKMTDESHQESEALRRAGAPIAEVLRGGQAGRRLEQAMIDAYNPSGIFIGPESKMWNKAAAFKASQLRAKKVDPREIWKQTGTFEGADGLLRQEIDDSVATTIPKDKWSWGNSEGIKQGEKAIGPVSEFMTHSNLAKAYDGIMDFGDSDKRMVLRVLPKQTEIGSLDGTSATVGMKGDTINKSTALHELQHRVQDIERFAEGGSPNDFLGAKQSTLDPFEQYRRLAGEAEARAVQKRMDYTPEQRRAVFPFDDFDVPLDQLIVRRNSSPDAENIIRALRKKAR